MIKNIFRGLGFILLCEMAGIVGAIFTTPNISSWYITLQKPLFSPPNFVFAPVWTLLYALMGISLYLVWSSKKSSLKSRGLKYFSGQLILNILWSIIFFGGHSIIGGLVIIVLLWILIFLTISNFQKINKLSAYLLYPYLAWVSFATILNFSLVLLNSQFT